jgi:hypothetical protein
MRAQDTGATRRERFNDHRDNGDETHQRERGDLQKQLDALERELASQAAAGEWKDEAITGLRARLLEMRDQVAEDRKDYNERMKFMQGMVEKLQSQSERYVQELVGINRLVGQLEAENRTLRQLPAGRREAYVDEPSASAAPDPYISESSLEADASFDQPNNPPQYHA